MYCNVADIEASMGQLFDSARAVPTRAEVQRLIEAGFHRINLTLNSHGYIQPTEDKHPQSFSIMRELNISYTISRVFFIQGAYELGESIRSEFREVLDQIGRGELTFFDLGGEDTSGGRLVNRIDTLGRELPVGQGGAPLPTVLQNVPSEYGAEDEVLGVNEARDGLIWRPAVEEVPEPPDPPGLRWESNSILYHVQFSFGGIYPSEFADLRAPPETRVITASSPILGAYDFFSTSGTRVLGQCLRPHVTGIYVINGYLQTDAPTAQQTPGSDRMRLRLCRLDSTGRMRTLRSSDPDRYRDRLLTAQWQETRAAQLFPVSYTIPLTNDMGFIFQEQSPNGQISVQFVVHRLY